MIPDHAGEPARGERGQREHEQVQVKLDHGSLAVMVVFLRLPSNGFDRPHLRGLRFGDCNTAHALDLWVVR